MQQNIDANAPERLRRFVALYALILKNTLLPPELMEKIFMDLFNGISALEKQLISHMFSLIYYCSIQRGSYEKLAGTQKIPSIKTNVVFLGLASKHKDNFRLFSVNGTRVIASPTKEPRYACLHEAAYHGDVESIQILLGRGHDVNGAYGLQQNHSQLPPNVVQIPNPSILNIIVSVSRFTSIGIFPRLFHATTKTVSCLLAGANDVSAKVASDDYGVDQAICGWVREKSNYGLSNIPGGSEYLSGLYLATHKCPPIFFAALRGNSDANEAALELMRAGASLEIEIDSYNCQGIHREIFGGVSAFPRNEARPALRQ